jgi:hypothetical protein
MEDDYARVNEFRMLGLRRKNKEDKKEDSVEGEERCHEVGWSFLVVCEQRDVAV